MNVFVHEYVCTAETFGYRPITIVFTWKLIFVSFQWTRSLPLSQSLCPAEQHTNTNFKCDMFRCFISHRTRKNRQFNWEVDIKEKCRERGGLMRYTYVFIPLCLVIVKRSAFSCLRMSTFILYEIFSFFSPNDKIWGFFFDSALQLIIFIVCEKRTTKTTKNIEHRNTMKKSDVHLKFSNDLSRLDLYRNTLGWSLEELQNLIYSNRNVIWNFKNKI